MTTKTKFENAQLNRRSFLQAATVGVALVALPSLSRAQQALVDTEDVLLSETADVIRVKSTESRLTPWTHHFHYLEVPREAVANPPEEGLRLSTSRTLFHHHKVPLTQEHLFQIANGETVTVEDTVHDHFYVISLAAEQEA